MKQKEIIEKLKEGYYIERKTIGYRSDGIFLCKGENKLKITIRQFIILRQKINMSKQSTEKPINETGGKIITITYKLL